MAEEEKEKGKRAEAQERPFTVTDKRFWVRGEEGETEEVAEYGGPKPPTFVEELTAQLEAKEEKLRQYIEAYKKMHEEMEKFRTRLHRDMDQRIEQAKANFLASFLSIQDNLERALQAAEDSSDLKALLEGIKLIYEQMTENLKREGVTGIEAEGQPFNPETEEAVEVIPVEESEKDGTVLKVLQKGYMLNERLIRPAKVAVGKWEKKEEEISSSPPA